MADLDVNDPLGLTDKRVGRGNTSTTHVNSEYTNMATIAAQKARLTTLAAASYSTARLATMTENDIVYALRLISDSGGIK